MDCSDFKLRILHFNDSYDLENTPPFLEEIQKRKDDKTLVLFSGDIFFPSVPSIKKLGFQMVKLLEILDIDVGILGNHDFDEGEKHCGDLIKTLNTTWVMSNLINKNGKALCGSKLYFTKTVAGFKIGFLGLIDENYIESSELNQNELIYTNYIKTAKEIVNILKKENCDIIIAMTHMLNKSDLDLLKNVQGIDLFLGGHQHCYMIEKNEHGVAIKSGFNFECFNEIEISFTTQNIADSTNFSLIERNIDKSKNFSIDFLIPRKNEKYNLKIQLKKVIIEKKELKTQYAEYVKSFMKSFYEETKTPLALFTVPFDITSSTIRQKETNIGNLLTSLIQIEYDSDVAFIQGGHFRSEKAFPENYLFLEYDLISLLPFIDFYRTFRISGERLRKLLEESYQHLPEVAGCFGQISGIKIALSPKEEKMKKIQSILKNSKRLENDEMIKLTCLEFCVRGKDGFTSMMDEEEVSTEHKKEHSLPIFLRFLVLPRNEKFREEFFIFKKMEIGLENLHFNPTKAKYDYLTLELVENHGVEVFDYLSNECIKRLKKYCLAQNIVCIEGNWIFSIDSLLEDRISIKE
jgi:5'-nucleotidase